MQKFYKKKKEEIDEIKNTIEFEEDNKSSIEKDLANQQIQNYQNQIDSDVLKLVSFLQNPSNLEANTILDDNEQVVGLTMMNWAGQVFDIDCFKQFVASYPKYKISGGQGIGRKQVIQVAEAVQREKTEERNKILEIIGKR